MISKSFIDLLFILLCATIVLLSESVRIGMIDTAPVEMGGGGVSRISIEDVHVVVVDEKTLTMDSKSYESPDKLILQVPREHCFVLVPATAELKHHRIMKVWDALSTSGFDVKLGARPNRKINHDPAIPQHQPLPEG